MEGKRLLRSMTLKNILSFGPEGQTLDFEPLNVLIGPNGSGKSNFIEIIGLLRSLPRDLSVPFREGGGITEWCWKGNDPLKSIFIETNYVAGFKHQIEIEAQGFGPHVVEERINISDNEINRTIIFEPDGKELPDDPDGTSHFLHVTKRQLPISFKSGQSFLSLRAFIFKEQTIAHAVAEKLSAMQIYRKWVFGPGSKIREPQKADLPSDFLTEDALNLGLVLNTLILDRRAKNSLLSNLRNLYHGALDIKIRIVSGYIEILIEEENGHLIPATRLSDGTLRYLSLLAILCHPDPPPLLCIEEPELGLHPDIIPTIAKLLIDASKRTQLIVTTHSADLVSALWEFPESVVVCQKGFDGETQLKRLDPKRLEKWLERYSLGELWLNGEIGGTRW